MMDLATTSDVKAACCAVWQHPAARLLLGDHLHPGGPDLTRRAIDAIEAPPEGQVVDVGCGPGASLRLVQQRGLRPFGIDLSQDAARQASESAPVLVGDGERLPFSDSSVDGALLECVLSLFVDKERALKDLKRVLKPGARAVVSDVVVERPLPSDLQGAAAWSCCLGGAASRQSYFDMMSDSGLRVLEAEDHADALVAAIEKVRRRLSLFEISAAVSELDLKGLGLSPDALERARTIAVRLIDEVRNGAVGYVLIVTENPR